MPSISSLRSPPPLSAGSRLRLIDRLAQGEQTVEELGRAADLTVPNASRQLRLLAEARLVVTRRTASRVLPTGGRLRAALLVRPPRPTRERFSDIDEAVQAAFTSTDPLEPVSQDELILRLDAGDALLLDVRPEPEYRARHLPGAISVPLPQLRDRLPDLPEGREIVAYCRGPYCFLSAEAVRELRSHGFRASRLTDGFPNGRRPDTRSKHFFASPNPSVALQRPGRLWHVGKVAFEQYWLRRWI